MVDSHLRQDGNRNDTELEDLRVSVMIQREQLQQKEEELLRHRQRYHGSSAAGNASNPYQAADDFCDGPYNIMIHNTMSRMCELLLSNTRRMRRLSQRSAASYSTSSPRLQARFIHTTNVVIIVILVLHFWQFCIMRVYLPEPLPVLMDSNTISTAVRNNVQFHEDVKPWTSIPPTPIRLMETNDPTIKQRHKCISAIRKRQQAFFQDFFENNTEVLLVDPAYHSNVGDVMLTIGELQLIQGTMQQEPPKQCHYIQSNHFYPLCDPTIRALEGNNRHHLALWHAGGNWGDLWRDAQDVRIPSLATLLENEFVVISMPQSLYYEDPSLKAKDIISIKTKVAMGLGLESATALDTPEGQQLAHSRVVLTWRERESFQEAKELYPFVRNVLVPDIAFQIGPYSPMLPSSKDHEMVDILLFLRDDKESKVSMERDASYIQSILPKPGITFRIVDWQDRLELFHTQDYLFTDSSIQLLALGKVVICDR
jgi:exopolysaccharide biosynthesis predicted pyruvyltransferase EpsI